jgi:hypothetical protein
MRYVEGVYGGKMVPYFAIVLFAGIRPDVRYGETFKITARYLENTESELDDLVLGLRSTSSPALAAAL